jgi:LysM repeat protein
MFDNNEDEYRKATQDAQVNAYARKRGMGFLIVVWNLFLLLSFTFLGYLGFNYIKNETTIFNDNPVSKTVVMGVSDTKSDSEYLEMLNSIDEIDETTKNSLSLSDAIDDVINTSTLRDNSLYTQAIAQEIDGNKYHQNSRVIFVEKGDTLGSISEKYYGSSMEFSKIIEANEKLSQEHQVIHIGQKLNIPY